MTGEQPRIFRVCHGARLLACRVVKCKCAFTLAVGSSGRRKIITSYVRGVGGGGRGNEGARSEDSFALVAFDNVGLVQDRLLFQLPDFRLQLPVALLHLREALGPVLETTRGIRAHEMGTGRTSYDHIPTTTSTTTSP